MLRVLIADDHPITLHGIRAFLGSSNDLEVIGQASDGQHLLELASTHSPDVALVDLVMPLVDGLEVTAEWTRRGYGGAVVILSPYPDATRVRAALNAGARGYVLKSDPIEAICEAVRAVAGGEVYLSPSLDDADLEVATEAPTHSEVHLTKREQQVLELVAEGLEAKEAADRLGIKHKTVLAVRLRLMRKLDLHSVAGLTRYAIQHGITPLESPPPL